MIVDPVRVFIGYDPREAVAYHVCCESIIANASVPVQIVPVALNLLAKFYSEQHVDGSNAFIYTRFLVPWLCSFNGHAVWLDGDMILRADIAELWDLRGQAGCGVQVVKHDYQTKYPRKYLGAKNEDYPRKNWSSVMLWNCNFFPHRKLAPEFVASAKGSYLHRFSWLRDDQIGALDPTWNHLAMEYEPRKDAKLVHFTVGAPCFEGYEQQEHSEAWYRYLSSALEPGWPTRLVKCNEAA